MANLPFMPDSRFIDAISVRPFRPSPSWALSSSRTTRPSVKYPAFNSNNAIFHPELRVLVLVCWCSCACARRACARVPVLVVLVLLCACACLLVLSLSFCARPVHPIPTDFPSSAWRGARTEGVVDGPGAGCTLYSSVRPSVRPSVCPCGLFFDHPRPGKLQGAVAVKQVFFVFASFSPKKCNLSFAREGCHVRTRPRRDTKLSGSERELFMS